MEDANDLLKIYMNLEGEYKEHRIPGTEDWVTVANEGEGGWDWCIFNAFYSPSARRFFWHGDSGCSCNSWDDDLKTSADFQDGDRDALLRAWEVFAKDSYAFSIEDYQRGVSRIRTFEVK